MPAIPICVEQKSNSYDATLEYYFKGGYVAIAGYYREITDRVINSLERRDFRRHLLQR